MVTTIKSGIQIRSDQDPSAQPSHFDDSWQRFAMKSAYTGNGDVEPRSTKYPSGFASRMGGKCRICTVFYDCAIGNGQLFLAPPIPPRPSRKQTRESFVALINSTMQKAESLYCGRRLTGKKGEIRAKKVVSVTMIEKSYASRIQTFLNPCIVEGSRFVSVCTDKGLCVYVCVCVKKWKKGWSVLETQEVYVRRCTQLDRQRISSGKQSRIRAVLVDSSFSIRTRVLVVRISITFFKSIFIQRPSVIRLLLSQTTRSRDVGKDMGMA